MFNSTNPDAGGAPVAPSAAFAAADICIWKDGSASQKASAAGITVTSPFDSIVGLHLVEIDTSNNTDAGFWTSGSVYQVRIVTAKTVASYSVSGLLIGEFSIEVQTARLAAITHTGAVIPTVTTVTQAVELDSSTVTNIKSGLATSAALGDVQTDVDAANNYLSALSGVFSGITSMANWLRRGFRKDAGTAGMETAQTEINNTGGAFAGTTDSLEAIRDNQSAGGGTAPTIVTLQSVAGISPGVIVGPSEPLVIGDDYLTAMNRSIRINLLDANGDPAEVEFGAYALDDAGISIQLLLHKSGKPSSVAQLVGTCTFFPAVSTVPPYLIVEFTRTETAKAIPGPYDMQAEAVWSDGKVVTFAPYGQIEFVRNISRS
jgi:hypothetical protein